MCTICNSGGVGDEFHYLLNFSNENVKRTRAKYVDNYYTQHPNVPRFCSLIYIKKRKKKKKKKKSVELAQRGIALQKMYVLLL